MSSYYSSNLRVLVGKLDQDLVTAAPEDADFDVRIWNPVITPIIEADDEASKYATGDHGEDESIMGAQSATIEFSVKMSSSKLADGFPVWWKFAKACGCEVIEYKEDPTVKGYALQPLKSKDISTMTIYVYDIPRGTNPKIVCYKFCGCMGNMTLGAEGVGKPWTANFSFTGKLVGIDDSETDIPVLSITDKTVAEKMLNYELTFGASGSQKISTFQLDVGNEISPLIDQADSTGYAYYSITKRNPRFSCNPLMNGSFKTVFENWKNEASFSVNMKPNITADRKDGDISGFTLYIPKAQQLTAAVASREGLINWDLNLKALRNNDGKDDEELDIAPEATWELLIGERTASGSPVSE